jgi:methionine-S-sulfoxide reductase
MPRLLLPALAAFAVLTFSALRCSQPPADPPASGHTEPTRPASGPIAHPDTALFAMGCFWCAETAFEGTEGVGSVVSGFTGGTVPHPTYDQVTRGGTGHFEAIQVVFDSTQIDYETLLRIFWHNIDPFDAEGQFCDRGDSYRAGLFPRTAAQRQAAEASKTAAEARLEQPVVTEILSAAPFYPAEDYHQDFWLKDPERYTSYRSGCRRDERLREVWGADALHAGDAL